MLFFPPSVYFHWISTHCDWRWQIWAESLNTFLPTGLKNTKHPEFYGEPDSGSPLKVCVYINCIFAEAWPSDGKMSDGHVAVYFMADYKAVTFGRYSHRPFFCPMGTEYDGAATLRKVSLLFSHPCFMPTKKNIWHRAFTGERVLLVSQNYDQILSFFNNRTTNASAESFGRQKWLERLRPHLPPSVAMVW